MLTPKHSVSNLKSFVEHITSENAGKHSIDPFNTFECYLEFVTSDKVSSTLSARLQRLFNVLIKTLTGKPSSPSDSGMSPDFHQLVETLSLPDVIVNGEQLALLTGKYNCSTSMPMPADNSFKMTVLNTAPAPIIETIIYPWLQACSGVSADNSEGGEVKDLNYPRADFTVKFPHLTTYTPGLGVPYYTYFNVRPISIEVYNPSNKPAQTLYRTITFTFDYFMIQTGV